MEAGNSAINILLDAVFTLQATTGGDDGVSTGRTVSGSLVTFQADKVTVKNGRNLQDHSGGQDAAEFNRTTKTPQSATVETKLAKKATAKLLGALLGTTGVVITFTATATGAVFSGTAIVENFEATFEAPSTLKFDLRQYGTMWMIANT